MPAKTKLCGVHTSENPIDKINAYREEPTVVYVWSIRIHSLNYLRSATLGCKDIQSRKSEVVAKTQFLYIIQGFSFQLNNF